MLYGKYQFVCRFQDDASLPCYKGSTFRGVFGRALPIAPTVVDWREGIEGVVTVPKSKSTSTELSDEAKTILKAAASSDGHIMCLRDSGGQTVQVGGKQLIPDQTPRTVARWVGGIEDLQRRRYIKDIGRKGEVFQITREGYEAVDSVSDE
jgi:hypothetical protein